MKPGARFMKIVEWSEEDQCYIGSCPDLFYGGCHGADQKLVFAALCDLVDETVRLYEAEKRPLPPVTSGLDCANAITRTTDSGTPTH